jgi:hypothetical protein
MKGKNMNRAFKAFNFVACLALLSAAPGFAQTPSAEATLEATASAPVAHVYIQTTKGVEAFSAESTGQLTLIKGSDFADKGEMGAINGAFLVSVGTDYLHTYKIESDGGVGAQASEIDTQNYGGAVCGPNQGGALFDHTGKYLYVLLWGASGDNPRSALQSYKIASSGDLTFLGDSENDTYSVHDEDIPVGISTISGNDNFAYGIISDVYAGEFSAFKRNSNGELVENANFTHTDPTPDPSGSDDQYFPIALAADPTNHLAVVVNEPFTNSPPPQLASYTINNSTGDIVSTNAWNNMPTPAFYPNVINMSPSGKFLAVAGAGIEIYNFNGASPLTLASSMPIPARDFSQLAWDKNSHLYALDYETGNLYVYTITSTSIKAAPGSPYTIPDNKQPNYQYGLIVVPKS